MPVRRRKAKRRVDPMTEMRAWEMVFASSHDFLGEVTDLTGLTEPVRVWPPEARGAARETWRAAACEAWGRVGRLYLETVHDPRTGEPWALLEFGEPEQCR